MSTPQSLIIAAFFNLGATAEGETPSTAELADGLIRLNQMLDSWSTEGATVYTRAVGTFALAPGQAAYTLGSGGSWSSVARAQKIEAWKVTNGVFTSGGAPLRFAEFDQASQAAYLNFQTANAAITGMESGLDAEITGLQSTMAALLTGLQGGMSSEINGLQSTMAAQVTGLQAGLAAQVAVLQSAMAAQIGTMQAELAAKVSGAQAELIARSSGAHADLLAKAQGAQAALVAKVHAMVSPFFLAPVFTFGSYSFGNYAFSPLTFPALAFPSFTWPTQTFPALTFPVDGAFPAPPTYPTNLLASAGVPMVLGADTSWPLINVRVFPVPVSAGSIEITYWTPIPAFTSLAVTVSLPPGYEDAIQFNLAISLAPQYARASGVDPALAAKAQQTKASIVEQNTIQQQVPQQAPQAQ